MSNDARSMHELIDRYVDGLLDGEQLAQFEAALATDAELRRQVELQDSIDDSLRRAFTPPAAAPAPATSDVVATIRPVRRFNVRFFALAAMLAIVAGGFFVAQRYFAKSEIKRLSPTEVYTRLNTTGWPVEFVCQNEKEFATVMSRQVGAPLYIPAETPGVIVAGWSYTSGYSGSVLGPSTMFLITKVDQQPVLVLIDKAQFDRPLDLPQGSPLHLHRREVSGVVMYEVSPLDAPHVINAMTEMQL